jgi:F-type H+-transporting ATPase subunit b
MKRRTQHRGVGMLLPILLFLLVMLPGIAVAAGPSWRPTYDLVMRWVNFFILAGIIFKYGREPLKNFLAQQKEDVLKEIDTLEAEKERILGEIRSADQHVEENRQKLANTKERLIAQGESQKQRIIEQAQNQSTIMIDEARKKMENRILQAKEKLKMELADLAFDQALKQLPQVITDADNQHFFDAFMSGMPLDHQGSSS